MLEDIKERVLAANIELWKKGVVIYTWGNVSEIDRESNCVVIKPSGIPYEKLQSKDMVVVDLFSGKVVEGDHNPSSDTSTHLEIYRAFRKIGGVAHTHSINATAFAQAGKDIKSLGTTHADYFYGDIPCTRSLKESEVVSSYEENTGKVIVETIKKGNYGELDIPAVLVKNHGPFTWGVNAEEAVYHAVVLETIAEINIKTYLLNSASSLPEYVLDKHYNRKHGENAYYGQKISGDKK